MKTQKTPSPEGDKEQPTYSVYDLGAAAALLACGFVFNGFCSGDACDGSKDPNKVRFVFEHDDGIEEAEKDYWEDEMMLEVHHYYGSVALIQARLRGEDLYNQARYGN